MYKEKHSLGEWFKRRLIAINNDEAKVVHIQHNAFIGQHETTVSEDMKTKAGKRDVPLSEELEHWLKERKRLLIPSM